MVNGVTGILLKLNGNPVNGYYRPRWIESCDTQHAPHRAIIFIPKRRTEGCPIEAMRHNVEFLVWKNGLLVDYRTLQECMLRPSPENDPIMDDMAALGWGFCYEFQPQDMSEF